MATELQTTVEGRRIPVGTSGTFSPKTGKFTGLGFNLSDLSKALQGRVQELGISMAKLEEWAATPHSLQADREYYSMMFDETLRALEGILMLPHSAYDAFQASQPDAQSALDQKAGAPTGAAAQSKAGLQSEVAALNPRAARFAQFPALRLMNRGRRQ